MAMDLSGFVKKRTRLKIGGKELLFCEVTLIDLANLRAKLGEQRKQVNAERRERLLADAKKCGEIDAMALLKLTDTSVTDDELDASMDTIEGVTFLIWRALMPAQPEITLEQVESMVAPNDLDRIIPAILPSDTGKKKPIAKGKVKKKS